MSTGAEPPELPRDLEDRIFREGLAEPTNLRAFLRQVIPDHADRFDCLRRRILPREAYTPDVFLREADLPLEVPFRVREGEEVWALILVLIEHQSTIDPYLPLRMLFQVVSHWIQQLRQWEGQKGTGPFRLAPVLPLVLHTGPRPWGSVRDLRGLYAGPEEFVSFVPEWGPAIWDLSVQDPDALIATGEGWMQLLALMRVEDLPLEQFADYRDRALARVAALAEGDMVHWRGVLQALFHYLTFRRPNTEREALRSAIEATHSQQTQEVRHMTQTIAEAWMDEARIQTMRETLVLLLQTKHGALPPEIQQRLTGIDDPQRLRELLTRVVQTDKLEDLGL